MRPIDADELKEIYCAECDNKHLCAETPACDTVRVLCSMPTIEALKAIEEIKEIINISNLAIQEDVLKYKMICEVVEKMEYVE